MARHILLEKYCAESGYTVEAIRKKIERGELVKGIHYDAEGDRLIKIDQEAMSLWARGVPGHVIKAWKDAEIQSVYASSSTVDAPRRSPSRQAQLT
jgi:hypothetical protein